MRRMLAGILFAAAAVASFSAARAQDAPAIPEVPQGRELPAAQRNAFLEIMKGEIAPERLELGKQLVKLSGTGRTFDEVLPNIAAESKTAFIRANPQMQLGIIEVVDRIALQLVKRRSELDNYLARAWASGFTVEEMQALVAFYSSPAGKKFAELHPQLLGVELAAAQEWGRSVSRELTQRVADELKATLAAEQRALQGDTAGPALTPEPAPAQ